MFRKKTNRRNRTAPTAAAYRSQRREPEATPIDNTARSRSRAAAQSKAKNTGTWWLRIGRRAGLLILGLAIIVSVINVLSVSPNAKIQPLTTSAAGGNALLRNQAEYQAAANQLLAASIWNRNKITINTSGISSQMVAKFPELTSVSVTLPLLAHRPTVYVQPAQASLVVAADNGAFVVDQNGRALMPSASLPTAHNLPQIVDQSGLQIQTGHQVLTSDDVAFVQTVIAELSAKHVGVTSMVLPPTARELDVYIAGQPYIVKFNLANNDPRQQAGTYLATAAQLGRQHITPAHYVDVRVDGRAYYQ